MKLVLDGKAGEASPLDTGIPQGPPAAQILFFSYLSGIFDPVEAAALCIRGLYFADNRGWCADGPSCPKRQSRPSTGQRAMEWLSTMEKPERQFSAEDTSYGNGEDRRQRRPIQKGGDEVARHLAILPAHLQGAPRHPPEEWEEGNGKGYNQEAYDAGCAALARVRESASRRKTTPERVTIFTDAQAVIRRVAADGPARQHHRDSVERGPQGSRRQQGGEDCGGGGRNSKGGLASRFHQTKTGHCRSRQQYLHWTNNRPTPQCWWCGSQTQTREHLFKVCSEWKQQQEIL